MSDRIKVFVSQPMANKTNEDIKAEREGIIDLMRQILGDGVEEIPSFFQDAPKKENMKPLRLMGMALQLMSDADVVVFAPEWETARGCRIEHECAVQYGYRVIDLSDGQNETDIPEDAR